jgi:septal ring factor EnvC (AmiA/AmiB activator)
MPPSEAYVLILLAAVIGSGSMVAVGMWLYSRVRRLEGEKREIVSLSGKVDEVREQLDQVQTHLGELHERVDFTERMLARDRDVRRELPPG